MQLENSGFGSVFVCNPETEEDMYRCYSTSCQLWSFVYVDCSLRIDHADISLNIFQVNKFHLKCKLIFKNAPSFRIPIYRKYRLAIYYLILHWKCWFTVASELWIFDFNITSLQFSARDLCVCFGIMNRWLSALYTCALKAFRGKNYYGHKTNYII